MLTKAFGRSKIEEFCAEIGQTEPCAETLDKESKGVRKTKEVKFTVEAIEMDETVKNRFKDARIAMAKNKLKDARIAKIRNESKVEKYNGSILWIDFSRIAETVGSVEDGQFWNRKESLNPWTQSWIEIAARVKD